MKPHSKSSVIVLTILGLALAVVLFRTGRNRSTDPSGADGVGLKRSTAEEFDTALLSGERTSTLLAAPKAMRGEKPGGKWTFKDSLASGFSGMITREQVETFLSIHGKSSTNLIAAYHATRDTNYLVSAARAHPEDPLIQMKVLAGDLFPEERSKWIEAFRASAPDNPLADFYAAKQAFDSKNSETAMAFIAGGALKEGFSDYGKQIGSSVESMLLFTGNGDVESKIMAVFGVDTPEIRLMEKSIALELAAYRNTLMESGDPGAAFSAAESGIAMAKVLSEGQMAETFSGQVLGMAMEAIAIKGLDDATAVSLTGQTSAERQQEIMAQKQGLKELVSAGETIADSSDRQVILQYLQILDTSGEIAAAQWWKARSATPVR